MATLFRFGLKIERYIRASREKYIQNNRLEVERLQADYISIINGAPIDADRIKGMF